MGLSRTVSEINGEFIQKSQNFPTPVYFELASLRIGCRRMGSKTRVMGLPGRTRNLTISSAVRIQPTNVTDGQTDRQTVARRQQRPRYAERRAGKTELLMACSNDLHTVNSFIKKSIYDKVQ